MSACEVSVVPVDVVFVMVELEGLGDAYLAEDIEDDGLLLGRECCGSATALVEGVATEVGDEEHRELLILGGVHLALEVGESTCIGHGLVVAIELAVSSRAALAWIDETQIGFMLQERSVGHAVQTGGSQRTVGM